MDDEPLLRQAISARLDIVIGVVGGASVIRLGRKDVR